MADPPSNRDWQITKKFVRERGQYLLDTGMWSDCRFIIGTEPTQQVLEGHKLFLAMSSPVFEAMFFGGMAEKEPISILDVQPDAFKALLEYIYTDKINLTSFDQACELCYGAKKYMLPNLVEECTKYLWSDLFPKNACRAYEFAKLFEEPILMDKCIDIICNQTDEVLMESSFDEVELSTILTVFDQDHLNITTELELFNALSRYAARHNHNTADNVTTNSTNPSTPPVNGASPNPVAANNASTVTHTGSIPPSTSSRRPTVKDALHRIRFLTLTPQEFAEGPAMSTLLSQQEKFALLMNISSGCTDTSMPSGFSANRNRRRRKRSNTGTYTTGDFNYVNMRQPQPMDTTRAAVVPFYTPPVAATGVAGTGSTVVAIDAGGPPIPPISGLRRMSATEVGTVAADGTRKLYCTRQPLSITEWLNNSSLDCNVTFTCDRNVCVYGIQVPAQVRVDQEVNDSRVQQSYANSTYGELLYAHLVDCDGCRLTYTHFTSRVSYRSLMEISFNRPVYIQKNKQYKVGVVMNKMGHYPIASYTTYSVSNGVVFTFPGQSQGVETARDGLIRSIIYSMQTNTTNTATPIIP